MRTRDKLATKLRKIAALASPANAEKDAAKHLSPEMRKVLGFDLLN